MNKLYYGDNLDVMRQHLSDESVDLVYLDPPFNSGRDYNAVFKDGNGAAGQASIKAFTDTWTWDEKAARAYAEILKGGGKLADAMTAFKALLGDGSTLAYLSMMAPRLTEIRRVMKPTASCYLHCDPSASHYLKILMDAVFGGANFRNEIVWSYRRWPAKSDNFQTMHDIILRYSRGGKVTWNQLYEPLAPSTIDRDGGLKISNVINPDTGVRSRGVKSGEVSQGAPMRDVWDISVISPSAKERLGYPTQKPVALLDRIIRASSNPGDTILDPFCLTGDTRIVTSRGLRQIQDVGVGDRVLTHEGRFRPVVKKHANPHDGVVVTIRRAKSTTPLRITPNHALLVVRSEPCLYDDRRCLPRECKHHRAKRHLGCPHPSSQYTPMWVPAGEIRTGDFIYVPNTVESAEIAPAQFEMPLSGHHNEKKVPATILMSEDVMEWIGWYASEGFVEKYMTHFANYEDAQRIADITTRIFGCAPTIKITRERGRNINFSSRAVATWISSLVGKLAPNKKLPEWVFGLTPELRQALLRGLFRGDGSFRKDKPNDESRSYKYSSSSPTLGHQVLRLVLQEGCVASYRVSMPKGGMIGTQVVRPNHPCYEVQVFNHTGVSSLLSATQEAPQYDEDFVRQPYDGYPFKNGFLYTVKSVTTGHFAGNVYNLEVEEDHSYVTDSFTAHNCGCGTTIDATQALGDRQWIGIDITHLAVGVIKKRLADKYGPDVVKTYQTIGEPADLAGAQQLATEDTHQFEHWALGLVGARSSAKGKGADGGVDGTLMMTDGNGKTHSVPISVKSGTVNPGMVQALHGILAAKQAPIGVFITLNPPTKAMTAAALAAGFYDDPNPLSKFADKDQVPRIQILSVADLLAGKNVRIPGLTSNTTIKRAKAL